MHFHLFIRLWSWFNKQGSWVSFTSGLTKIHPIDTNAFSKYRIEMNTTSDKKFRVFLLISSLMHTLTKNAHWSSKCPRVNTISLLLLDRKMAISLSLTWTLLYKNLRSNRIIKYLVLKSQFDAKFKMPKLWFQTKETKSYLSKGILTNKYKRWA